MSMQKNKLWLKGFSQQCTDEEVRRFCDKYGRSIHMARPLGRDYIFLTYCSDEEAQQARQNFQSDRYFCNYAFNKTKPVSVSTGALKSSPPTSPKTNMNGDKDQRRVHFSSNVTETTPPSNRVANGTTKSNDVPISPPKTIFHNGEKILITHIQSANTFYAHPVSKDNERHELIKKMSQLAKDIDCVKAPQKMIMALAPFNRDYYRAILKGKADSMNDTVLVTLVDTGLSLDVPFDKLKPIPSEYTKIKITHRFVLDGIADDSCQSYAAKCFESYICKELTMNFDGDFADRLTRVQLIDPNTEQNVNDLVKQMQCTFNIDQMIKVPASVGNNRTLITVDETKLASGCNLITLVDSKDLPEFNKQTKRIQAVGNILNSYPPYMPMKDEVCLVIHAGSWHRAVFIEEATCSSDDGDNVCIFLNDLYKGIFVNSKFIRNITAELVNMPILTFVGALKGSDEKMNKNEVASVVDKFKPMSVVRVKSICESSEGVYTIDI